MPTHAPTHAPAGKPTCVHDPIQLHKCGGGLCGCILHAWWIADGAIQRLEPATPPPGTASGAELLQLLLTEPERGTRLTAHLAADEFAHLALVEVGAAAA